MEEYSEQKAFQGVASALTPRDKPVRQQALEEAIKLICGDRNETYGGPVQNFTRGAAMMRAYMGDRQMYSFSATDYAAFNVIIKLARVANSPEHRDSWVDMAGYAALGLECAHTPPPVTIKKDNR